MTNKGRRVTHAPKDTKTTLCGLSAGLSTNRYAKFGAVMIEAGETPTCARCLITMGLVRGKIEDKTKKALTSLRFEEIQISREQEDTIELDFKLWRDFQAATSAPAPARIAFMEALQLARKRKRVDVKHPWLVVRKRDIDAPEVYPFDNEKEAAEFYDDASMQWSDTFLCEVKKGPKV